MGLTTDQIMAGANLAWILAALTAGVYFLLGAGRRLRRRRFDDTTRIMVGVALVCFGSVVHRAYWAFWRWFRTIGSHETAALFPDAAAGLGSVTVAVICLGYALHLYPMTRRLFGRLWFAAVTLFLGAGFLCGAYAPRLWVLLRDTLSQFASISPSLPH